MLVRQRGALLTVLFAATLLVSSALLFLVEPMFSKLLLPLAGGSPAVWNTAVLFFQLVLLAGYAYAHWAVQKLGVRRHAVVHITLLIVAALTLPIGIPDGWSPPTHANPVGWLLLVLVVGLGLPFFVVSAAAPLLQRWFAATPHPSAGDPYFLYRASNLGSMLGLVAYPAIVEPLFRLPDQAVAWSVGYGLLAALTLACATAVWRRGAAGGLDGIAPAMPAEAAEPIRAGRKLRWATLAFVLAHMLGVTTYLTTDIAPVPLLWVIPLALYLLTFVVAFAPRPILPHRLALLLQLMLVVPLLAVFVRSRPVFLLIPLHLAVFFVSALVCHGELARDRPPAARLTDFYLWIALGGVLGGVFNAVIAPLIFDRVIEYPLAIVLACLLRPAIGGSRRISWGDVVLPVLLAPITLGLAVLARTVGVRGFAVPAVYFTAAAACFAFRRRPLRLALGILAVLAVSISLGQSRSAVLYSDRTFFGLYRVERQGDLHVLIHGNTTHGAQAIDPAGRRDPLTYYYRRGPIGQVFSDVPAATQPQIAVVGLGTGSLAAYARPGQGWTFYEIDPEVERIARDPKLFTYLRDAPADPRVVLGDARLSLRDAPGHEFGILVIDAFTSDAVPVHLLTKEALGLYFEKTAEGGVVAFHVSNRYLDLEPVLGALARGAGVIARVRADPVESNEDARAGAYASTWVVMARSSRDLGGLADDPSWKQPRASTDEWTDAFSNILSVFRWGE